MAKYSRLGILVDRDDLAGFLHPRQVLDGSGNGDGQIDFGANCFSGLSDLPGIRGVTIVNRVPARSPVRVDPCSLSASTSS